MPTGSDGAMKGANWPTARSSRSIAAPAISAPVQEIRVGGVDPGRERLRLEEAEERPQLVLDHQRMSRAAAGRAEQHRLSDERQRVEQVEQVLEEPAVAALVDRARKHQRIGRQHGVDRHAGRPVQLREARGRAQRGHEGRRDRRRRCRASSAPPPAPPRPRPAPWFATACSGCPRTQRSFVPSASSNHDSLYRDYIQWIGVQVGMVGTFQKC